MLSVWFIDTSKWNRSIFNVISFICGLLILLHFFFCHNKVAFSFFLFFFAASLVVECLDIYRLNFHKNEVQTFMVPRG